LNHEFKIITTPLPALLQVHAANATRSQPRKPAGRQHSSDSRPTLKFLRAMKQT